LARFLFSSIPHRGNYFVTYNADGETSLGKVKREYARESDIGTVSRFVDLVLSLKIEGRRTGVRRKIAQSSLLAADGNVP